jgi:hypothetical protein
MPIGEITGEVFGGALRIIGRVFAEVIFEIYIRGLGYLICRPFSRSVNPDGVLVPVVGLAAWASVLVALYFGYEFISGQIEIDRCLDSGRSYDHKASQCNLSGA